MKTRLLLLVFALLVCISSVVQASGAFDAFTGAVDNGAGAPLWLTDVGEYPSGYTAYLQSLIPSGSYAQVYVAQPMLNLRTEDSAFSWTGFGMCIDTAHFIYVGDPHNDYRVYDWFSAKAASKLGTIQPPATTGHSIDYIWNRLTYMWATTPINTDVDRAALQTATWFGCADQWDGNSGANFSFSGLDSTVLDQAKTMLAAAHGQDSTYSSRFVVFADGSQTFVGSIGSISSIPEPASILALLCGIVGLSGLMLRKRR